MELLIVDDDDDFRAVAADWMSRHGMHAVQAGDGRAARQCVAERQFDVVILDLHLPDVTGLELLREFQTLSPEMEVLVLTGAATVETAVEAMKCGACDYLSKPFPLAELEARCRKASERGHLRRESVRWKQWAQRQRPSAMLVGDSPAMKDIDRLIERVGPTDAPVLIHGETGTGKELAARAIQRLSRRAEQPFVTVNCAALPEQLVESELFGHEKGAFTGAMQPHAGLFEIADEGTLFIDEIGELPWALQPKFLRVLEDGSFRRIGSGRERRADVRIIAATNRDLAAEVQQGRFREDLLYRINVLGLKMPALRDHSDDIAALVRHFLPEGWHLEPDADAALRRFSWPGNVRQLRNVLERATILAEDRTITLDDLPPEFSAPAVDSASLNSVSETEETSLAAIEKSHVLDVLERCAGNKSQAAKALGIHRRKLYRLMARLGLS